MEDDTTVTVEVTAPEATGGDELTRWDALSMTIASLEGRLTLVEGMAHTHEGGPDHALEVAEIAEEIAEIALEEAVEASVEIEEIAEEVEEVIEEVIEPPVKEPEPIADEPPAREKDAPPRSRHWLYRPVYSKE